MPKYNANGALVVTFDPNNWYVDEYIYHLGDLDTYIRFTDDRIRVVVGGVDILDITEAGADTVVWNEGGADVDFRIEAIGSINAFFVQGSDSKVGFGTGVVPHGLTGAALVALEGQNAAVNGPHMQFTTASDDYPLLQILPWEHDDVSIAFDSYYDGIWKSSDGGSNFRISKGDAADRLKIEYDSAVAQGAAITWNTGIELTVSGNVTIPVNLSLGEYLYHDGEVDTYIQFTLDRIRVLVGNVDILDITEAGADTVVWNEGGADVDFRVEGVGAPNALFVQGSDGFVGFGTNVPTVHTHIVDNGNAAIVALRTENMNVGAGAQTLIQLKTDAHFGDYTLEFFATSIAGDLAGIQTRTTPLRIGTIDADDLYFITTSLDRFRIDASGNVTKANNPAFLVRADGTQINIVEGVETTVAWGTEIFDIGGHFATPNFTAPVTGSYLLSCGLYLGNADSASLALVMKLITTARTYISRFQPDSMVADDTITMNLTVVADMVAGNTAYVTIEQAGGANQMDVDVVSWFSGALLG